MDQLASLLPLIAIFAIFWLLVIRPAQRRQKKMRTVQAELTVGDEVLTNSGIYGTVASLEEDRVGLEVADGVVMNLARAAVVGVQQPAGVATDTESATGTGPETTSETPGQADDQKEL